MAPDAEYSEAAPLRPAEYIPVHQGSRIIPHLPPPVTAWTENEAETNPDENRKLLPVVSTPTQKSCMQSDLTLEVYSKHPKCPQTLKSIHRPKSKLQKRKEKLIAVLKPPYFILSMIVVMVSVHLFTSPDFREQLQWAPGAWWREPWRLLTYGFVHANHTHLALNALVALVVGWRLEKEQGWVRVVCVWCGGTGAGALGAGALQPHTSVVGASAAVYALLTSHIPNVCLRFGHISLWWFRPLSVVVLAASEGCWALMQPSPDASSLADYRHVAWAAHLMGAVAGIPLAFIVFRGENDGKRYITICRILSGVTLSAGIISSILFYVLTAR